VLIVREYAAVIRVRASWCADPCNEAGFVAARAWVLAPTQIDDVLASGSNVANGVRSS